MFAFTKKKALQTDDLCLDVSAVGGPVKLYQCHGLGGNQKWHYDQEVTITTDDHQGRQPCFEFMLFVQKSWLLLHD